MKKSLFKLILGVFATVLLFTSCLGDSSRSEEFSTFAYITTVDGVQCAAIGGVYFWSPRIETLSQGRCYILGYRTNYEAYSSKILLAEDIAEPILLTTTYSRIESPTIEDTFNPISFAPYYGSSNSFYGDNWGVAYITTKLKESDTPNAYFFYDSNRQYEMVDGVRQDVKKNQMIIDVRFNYTPGADGGTVLKRQCLSVGNLSQIRQEYKMKNSDNFEFGSEGYVSVAIRFRYNQLQSDGQTVKTDVYVGDWNPSLYYLLYYKTDL